ncbi:GAD-like domain-containing protein [Tateyamaria sp. SN6-1]|uniref:GAD-like domain-containing protein n=1 Tax=Tateyamaria sp. SN6-1 TaxID=3092148 RepID=UPI0039F58718
MARYSDHPGADARLRAVLEAQGPMTLPVVPPADMIAGFVGRVPDILLDLWSDTGVGDLRGGAMRLCLPSELAPQMATLFRADPDFGFPEGVKDPQPAARLRHTDVHAIAHSPFGDIIAWSERHGFVHINIVQGLVAAPFLFNPKGAPHPDDAALDFILGADDAVFDMDDRDMQPMLAPAVDTFGPLKRMFIYAPGPAATHDPIPTLDVLFPHSYPEWLDERIASKRWTLADLAGGRLNVRRIGPQPKAGKR